MRTIASLAAALSLFALGTAIASAEEDQRDLTVDQTTVAQAGADHPGSLRVTSWFDRADLVYAQGETVHLYIKTNEDAFVTVLDVGPSGQAIQLFPNAFQTNNLVKANLTVEIPASSSGARITVAPPFGVELVKVIASNKPVVVSPESQLESKGAFRTITGGASAVARDLEVNAGPAGDDRRIALVNRMIRTVANRSQGTASSSASSFVVVQSTTAPQNSAAVPSPAPGSAPVLPVVAPSQDGNLQTSQNPFALLMATDKSTYRLGEKVTLAVTTLQACYLTVIDINSAGQGRVVFPNQITRNNAIAAQQTVMISGGPSPVSLEARAPGGSESLYAVCSSDATPITSITVPSGKIFAEAAAESMTRDLALVSGRPAGSTSVTMTTITVQP